MNPDYTKEQGAAERTRTSTGLLPTGPQPVASTVPPLPHKIYQNKSRIRTDSHRLRAYAGYSPEPGITLRVFQFAPPYPSRLDWTRIRDFHHIFSGVIRISLLPPSPTQGGASNISANSRGGAGWSRTTDTGIFSPVLYQLSYRPINLTEDAINPSHLGYLDSPPRKACCSSLH